MGRMVAGAEPRLCGDRRVGDDVLFYLLTLLANHTHLASYTRAVSLHRVGSRSHDSRSQHLRTHHHDCGLLRLRSAQSVGIKVA